MPSVTGRSTPTPVSLISVEDLSSKTAESAGPIAFVLANDVQVAGATVAKIGADAAVLTGRIFGSSGHRSLVLTWFEKDLGWAPSLDGATSLARKALA